jgi:twitching motility protein PilT
MSTMQIDRLLDTVVKTGASDLHLTVGRQPTDSPSRRAAKPSDQSPGGPMTWSRLMKAITPERNQQEIQEEGGTDFGFAWGDAARFRVIGLQVNAVIIAIVLRQIPNRLLTFDQIGLPGHV